jgi:para-aminobenzoate synthetase component 1
MYPEIPFMSFEELYPTLDSWGISGKPFLFFVDFLGEKAWAGSEEEALKYGIKMQLHTHPSRKTPEKIILEKNPLPFKDYEEQFYAVRSHLTRGNSFLVNLTTETAIQCDLDLNTIFELAEANYKLFVPDSFVVFSPETFIRIDESHQITSFPMKGTRPFSDTSQKELSEDAKEQAEHATIVDLIRNDLSQVAFPIQVNKYKYIEKIKTNTGDLHQMSSAINGKILPEFQGKIGSILHKLLPAGSISGAPKPKTLEIIQGTESYQRGFYTGIMGRFDGEKLDSGVMIRFIEKRKDQLFFKSGGGITIFSNAKKEYEELIQKIYLPF